MGGLQTLQIKGRVPTQDGPTVRAQGGQHIPEASFISGPHRSWCNAILTLYSSTAQGEVGAERESERERERERQRERKNIKKRKQ